MEEELYEWWFEEYKELPFEIIDHGEINYTDGPDINNAIIDINGVRHCGQIELDYKSSYWLLHGHFQNHRFRDVLFHLTMHNDINLSTGYIPKYSFSIDNLQLTKNTVPAEFWARKMSLIESYTPFYSKHDIFEILFARSLGFFHNRDIMTYIATLKLNLRNAEIPNLFNYLKSAVNEFKRSNRPNNRLDIRLNQYLKLTKSETFLKETKSIARQRYNLAKMIKEIKTVTDQYNLGLGKDRIVQWIFNGIIPYELFFIHKDETSYKLYLFEIIEELKQLKAISSFHS